MFRILLLCLVVILWPPTVFATPCHVSLWAYTHEIPQDFYLNGILWNGHDVIIDALYLHTWCSCPTPSEAATWSALKAAYR
ncbi:hypothetical protein KKG45_04015 [bacterium]|nr:hypothetical protein [bacterium]MBU1072394.1 hypothetical protein [bacterium]MBU1675022.1 hypothetical protein [bacterium]